MIKRVKTHCYQVLAVGHDTLICKECQQLRQLWNANASTFAVAQLWSRTVMYPWSPTNHHRWPPHIRTTLRTLMLIWSRGKAASPLGLLSKDTLWNLIFRTLTNPVPPLASHHFLVVSSSCVSLGTFLPKDRSGWAGQKTSLTTVPLTVNVSVNVGIYIPSLGVFSFNGQTQASKYKMRSIPRGDGKILILHWLVPLQSGSSNATFFGMTVTDPHRDIFDPDPGPVDAFTMDCTENTCEPALAELMVLPDLWA